MISSFCESDDEERKGKPIHCLIHIYDAQKQRNPQESATSHALGAPPLRLHDLIEVIGIVESPHGPGLTAPLEREVNDRDEMAHSTHQQQPRKKQRVECRESVEKSVRFEELLSEEEEELFSLLSSCHSHLQLPSSYPSSSPHSSTPHLHCLFYHHIAPSHPFHSSICDPDHGTLSRALTSSVTPPSGSGDQANQIIQSLSSLLHDSLVAQYLTLALISFVSNRIDTSKAIGNLPLNIWNSNSISAETYQRVLTRIREIVPRVVEVRPPLPHLIVG
jgi:hypothetical protein